MAGLAFEWPAEARDDGTCVVRLVNSGFGAGPDGDGPYEAMAEGRTLFLMNLALHLRHFPGQSAAAMPPTAMWSRSKPGSMARLTSMLGLNATPAVGDRGDTSRQADVPPLVGRVVDAAPCRLTILVEEPAPGTAFVACEGPGADDAQTSVSVWSYLYGVDSAAIVERDCSRWQRWRSSPAGRASPARRAGNRSRSDQPDVPAHRRRRGARPQEPAIAWSRPDLEADEPAPTDTGAPGRTASSGGRSRANGDGAEPALRHGDRLGQSQHRKRVVLGAAVHDAHVHERRGSFGEHVRRFRARRPTGRPPAPPSHHVTLAGPPAG